MIRTFYKLAISFFTIVFLILMFLIFRTEESGPLIVKKTLDSNANSELGNERTNQHLFLTNEKIKIDEQKSKIHADAIERQLKNTPSLKGANPTQLKIEDDWGPPIQGVEMSGSQNEPETPDETIQRQLYEKQFEEAYNESYREAYADQFIENARKNGYEVKLNSDFRVISVKKIKQ